MSLSFAAKRNDLGIPIVYTLKCTFITIFGCVKLAWDSQLGISILPNHNRYFTILYYYGINRIPISILQTPRQFHTLIVVYSLANFFTSKHMPSSDDVSIANMKYTK